MVSEMLSAWGQRGLELHVTRMQAAYAHRADVIVAAAEEHLSGVATWQTPHAGMFLWVALGVLRRLLKAISSLSIRNKRFSWLCCY